MSHVATYALLLIVTVVIFAGEVPLLTLNFGGGYLQRALL